MNQSAIVKKELKNGVVEVSLLRQVECGLNCSGNCSGCMQPPKQEILAVASNPIGAKPGDRVEVEPTVGNSIGMLVLVFALPCLGLVLGYLLGKLAGLGDLAAMGTAVVGLVVAFLPAILVNRSLMKRQAPEFTILKQLF